MKKLLAFSIFIACFVFPLAITAKKNVVCYYASWTVYRPGNGQFDIDNIDTSLCSIINFAFLGLNVNGSIEIIDPWESDDDGLRGFRRLVALKQKDPTLKIVASMGGWNEGSEKYSIVAADSDKRNILAHDILKFLKEYGFDGFDLDWEYPTKRDSAFLEQDKENFVKLLKQLKTVLYPYGYILTAAVSGAAYTIDDAYHVQQVSRLLDIINIMAYDFHGHFEPYVGHVAPLYASHLDVTEENRTLNVATAVEHWIESGADPAKIYLGVATYGRCLTLEDPTNTQLYAPITGGGEPGPYTRQEGFLGYNEVCELHSDWQYFWDDEQKVPHRVSGDQWVGYEDTRSIQIKVEFANSKNLGGIMVWALDTDDFRGICGETYPLLRTVNKYLK